MGLFSALFGNQARCVGCSSNVEFKPVKESEYRFVAWASDREHSSRPSGKSESVWCLEYPCKSPLRSFEHLLYSLIGQVNNAHTRVQTGKPFFLCAKCIESYVRPLAKDEFELNTTGFKRLYFESEHFANYRGGTATLPAIWGTAELGNSEAALWLIDFGIKMKGEGGVGPRYKQAILRLFADLYVTQAFDFTNLSTAQLAFLRDSVVAAIEITGDFTEEDLENVDAYHLLMKVGPLRLSTAALARYAEQSSARLRSAGSNSGLLKRAIAIARSSNH